MFRLELDALNALVIEQKRTNELLESLLERGIMNELHTDVEGPNNHAVGVISNIRNTGNKGGTVQPGKRTGQRGRKRDS